MSRPVYGPLTLAYVFALSQFAMAWILFALYMRRARRFDALAAEIVAPPGAEFRPMTQSALVMFCVFVGISLVITYWASGRSTTSRGFYTAHRQISGIQNGWAIAGDYMSAASFLGITGFIAFFGFDGFMYSVGWFVAYLTVLFLVAEPLRNAGKYTLVDVISFRLRGRGVRAIAAISTLVITLFYMMAQMVGAGSLVNLLIQRVPYEAAIIIVGMVMLIYVLFGGMLATTWVQIIKAGLLIVTAIAMSLLVLAHFGFSFLQLARAAPPSTPERAPSICLRQDCATTARAGALDLISLGLALVLGTAGLPHILMRFFTVPSATAARTSVAWAMALIGAFYLTTSSWDWAPRRSWARKISASTFATPKRSAISRRIRRTRPPSTRHLAKTGYIVPTKNQPRGAAAG